MDWAKKNQVLMDFIKEKSKEVEPPSIKCICRDFAAATGDTRTMSALEKLLYRNGPKIQDMVLEMDEKVRMLFMLSVSIKQSFLEGIRLFANVSLDKRNRIQYYEAHDGHLFLRRMPHLLKDRDTPEPPMNYTEAPDDYDPQGDYLNMDSSSHFSDHVTPNILMENSLKRKLDNVGQETLPKMPHRFENLEDNSITILKAPKEEPSEEAEVSKYPTRSSFMSCEHPEQSACGIDFLKQMQSLVGTFNSMHLLDIGHKIENKIKEIRVDGLVVTNKTITMALESALHYVVRNVSLTGTMEDSVTLREFLLVFRATTFHLADFSEAINEVQGDIGFVEKRAPFQKIQNALQFALGFVLP